MVGRGTRCCHALAFHHDRDRENEIHGPVRRLVGRRRGLPVHDDRLCRGLFLCRILRHPRDRVRRAPWRDRTGLLDRGVPLFPARPARRPDRRPHRAAPARHRRPAAGGGGPGDRLAGRQPVADLSRLRHRRRRWRRALLRAEYRRGPTLVRPPARHRKRHRRGRHRRHPAVGRHFRPASPWARRCARRRSGRSTSVLF